MKACLTCGVTKSVAAFYAFINRHGKPYRRGTCKECLCARSKPQSEAWYSENKERHQLRRKTRYAENPTPMIAAARARYAAKLDAMPSWANTFFIEEAYALARLRTEMTGLEWQVDHIVPLQSPTVCGLHVEHNLRVIPATFNRAKGNRYWPHMPVDIDLSERTVPMS